MHLKVILSEDADNDLEDIYDYFSVQDSTAKAEKFLRQLKVIAESLSIDSQRRSFPPELQDLGVTEYRQVFLKQYRLIYRVLNDKVRIYLITDAKRDLQALLIRRLLR